MSTLQQHKVKAYWNTFIISIIVFYSQNQFNKLGNTMKETRYWSSQEMSPDTCSVIHPQNIIFINFCTLKVYSVPSGLYHHQAEMLGCLWHVRNKFVSPLCSRIYVCATSNKSLGKRILKFSFYIEQWKSCGLSSELICLARHCTSRNVTTAHGHVSMLIWHIAQPHSLSLTLND